MRARSSRSLPSTSAVGPIRRCFRTTRSLPRTRPLWTWRCGKTARLRKILRQAGKVTLMISDKGVNYYLKGSVRRVALRNARGGAGVAFPRHPGAGYRGPRTQCRDYYRVNLSAHDQARCQRFCSEGISLTARGVMKFKKSIIACGFALGRRRCRFRLLAHGAALPKSRPI